jgi:hypothetical protein
MRITLPDEVADQYFSFAGAHGVPIETAMIRQLQRLSNADPYEKIVVLGGDDLLRLAERLHGGDVQSAKDLVTKVERLASISFEGVNLQLTPAQLEELQPARAPGKTVEERVKEIDRLATDFFHTAGSFASV